MNDEMTRDEIFSALHANSNKRNAVYVVLCDNEWHGVPIAVTDEYVLLRQLVDFRFDGYVVVRLSDVVLVVHDEFATRVIRSENMHDFTVPTSVTAVATAMESSMHDVVTAVMNRYRYAVLDRNEEVDEFHLGEIVRVSNDDASIVLIDGEGVCEKVPTRVPIDEIAVVRFDELYVNLCGKYSTPPTAAELN